MSRVTWLRIGRQKYRQVLNTIAVAEKYGGQKTSHRDPQSQPNAYRIDIIDLFPQTP